MGTEEENDVVDAPDMMGAGGIGPLIDDILTKDDGEMLAMMARLRTNLMESFGRDGIVRKLCESIEGAKHVKYYSKRSKREIDLNRPTVTLVVDSPGAVGHYRDMVLQHSIRTGEDLDVGDPKDLRQQSRIAAIKADVIHREVCEPLITSLNAELHAQWQKAKKHYVGGPTREIVRRSLGTPSPNAVRAPDRTEVLVASMILSQIFAVGIGSVENRADVDSARTKGRMCTLRVVL